MPTFDWAAAARREGRRHKNEADPENPRDLLIAGLPVTERRLRLAGIETAVLEGGDGPSMVLLHGPGEYAAKWRRIIPELVKAHRVIAPDLPGHGTSEVAAGAIDADHILKWLGELIEKTCKTPPVLVGQIIGGAIAARFAAAHSEKLQCLVLSDTLGLVAFEPNPEFGAALMTFVAHPSADNHDRLWQFCAFDLDRLRHHMGPSWEWLRAYNLDRAQAPNLKPTQQSLMEHFGLPAIPSEQLARISVPTILIWGRHDLATPLSVAEAQGPRYGWPLHVVDGAGDDPPIEQPAAFVEVLRTALAKANSGDRRDPRDTRKAWDRIATGYDQFVTPSHLWLGQESLRRIGLRPGLRFLDVAAGTGALSVPAARLGADVLATDISRVMLDQLQARAAAESLAIETRVMDGHALELADGSFDMAGSQFGVMLFPDMPKGIREMVRVIKDGGRVLLNVYGDPHEVEFIDFFVTAIKSARPSFPGLPTNPPPLPFQLRDPEELRHELVTAGLRDVRVEMTTERMEFSTGDELWQWLMNSNPIPSALLAELDLTAEETTTIRQALDRMVSARVGASGTAVLVSPINIGIGTK